MVLHFVKGCQCFKDAGPYETFPDHLSNKQRQVVRLSRLGFPFQTSTHITGSSWQLSNRTLAGALYGCWLPGQIRGLAAVAQDGSSQWRERRRAGVVSLRHLRGMGP